MESAYIQQKPGEKHRDAEQKVEKKKDLSPNQACSVENVAR